MLTELRIRSLKHAGTQKTYFDFPNFGIRIGKHRKVFVVMIGRERRRVSLGQWPYLTLKDARIKAITLLHSPPSRSILFSECFRQFTQLHLATLRPSTAKYSEHILANHFGHLFHKPLGDVTRTDIVETLDRLKDTPAAAAKALSCLTTMLHWAQNRSLLQTNPLHGFRLQAKTKSRSRVLTDDELKTIVQLTFHSTDPLHQRVALLLLTGQRRNEIGRMEWSWISDTSFTVPAHIAKNGIENTIPLTPHMQTILSTIPRTSSFLFPVKSDPTKPDTAWSWHKSRFDTQCKFKTPFVFHDLRRTLSTRMAQWDIAPPQVVEAILNHTSGSQSSIARVYNRHTYFPQVRDALQLYEAKLLSLCA